MKIAIISRPWDFLLTPTGAAPVAWSTRVGTTLRRSLRALGWSGVLAIAVLASAPVFYFSVIHAAQERLDLARHKAIALNRQLAPAAMALKLKADTPAAQLAQFYKRFPAEGASPEWLEKLVAVAQSRGLSLNEGEYKVTREKAGRLLRFHMTLPLKGEYPQIRKFLAALPGELPVVALENVQFERQKVADPIVEVSVKLILFLEQAP